MEGERDHGNDEPGTGPGRSPVHNQRWQPTLGPAALDDLFEPGVFRRARQAVNEERGERQGESVGVGAGREVRQLAGEGEGGPSEERAVEAVVVAEMDGRETGSAREMPGEIEALDERDVAGVDAGLRQQPGQRDEKEGAAKDEARHVGGGRGGEPEPLPTIGGLERQPGGKRNDERGQPLAAGEMTACVPAPDQETGGRGEHRNREDTPSTGSRTLPSQAGERHAGQGKGHRRPGVGDEPRQRRSGIPIAAPPVPNGHDRGVEDEQAPDGERLAEGRSTGPGTSPHDDGK